jgi:hypothetical protein
MPNGRNAGRLFPDCTNEHGHGESHALPRDVEPGIVTCTNCEKKFLLTDDGRLQPIEWKNAPSFAEVAEVLGIPTDHIISTVAAEGAHTVLYTPNLPENLDVETDDPPIWGAQLQRDHEGILRFVSEPRLLSLTWQEIRAQMDEQIRARIDELQKGE